MLQFFILISDGLGGVFLLLSTCSTFLFRMQFSLGTNNLSPFSHTHSKQSLSNRVLWCTDRNNFEDSFWLVKGFYDNTDCVVFNQKVFWLKVICSQMKLPNFQNWSNGELSKIMHYFRKLCIILENKAI